MDEGRDQVLSAFGVTEEEINALPDTRAMRAAKVERERFVADIVDRATSIAAELSEMLPPGFHFRFEEVPGELSD